MQHATVYFIAVRQTLNPEPYLPPQEALEASRKMVAERTGLVL